MTAAASLTIAAAAAFIGTSITLPLLLPWLRRHAVDQPNHRSSHQAPVPRGGGLAVVVGILIGSSAAGAWTDAYMAPLLVAIVVLTAVGFADDLGELPVRPRLIAQGTVAATLAWLLLDPSGVVGILTATAVITFLVGYTNAFNFMDGINAISGVTTVVAGAWFTWLAIDIDADATAALALCVAVAAAAFLPWNAPRAKVFLGDAGSYGLGLALAGLAVALSQQGASRIAVLAPLVIYLADTAWALMKRVKGGRSWRAAHREHAYQRIADGGFSHLATSLVVAAFCVLECAIWVVFGSASALPALIGFAVVGAAYLSLPSWVLGRVGRSGQATSP